MVTINVFFCWTSRAAGWRHMWRIHPDAELRAAAPLSPDLVKSGTRLISGYTILNQIALSFIIGIVYVITLVRCLRLVYSNVLPLPTRLRASLTTLHSSLLVAHRRELVHHLLVYFLILENVSSCRSLGFEIAYLLGDLLLAIPRKLELHISQRLLNI